jgi:hypothetical protein
MLKAQLNQEKPKSKDYAMALMQIELVKKKLIGGYERVTVETKRE